MAASFPHRHLVTAQPKPTRKGRELTHFRFVAVLAAAAALGAGCSNPQEDAVRATADAFTEAVAARNWTAACALLAPSTRAELESSAGKPCPAALEEEAPPTVGSPDRIEVFGTMAQLRYPGETLFLTRFHDAWHVLAAACTARAAKPYDCTVKGA